VEQSKLVRRQLHHAVVSVVRLLEEPTVEAPDVVEQELPARGHRPEQVPDVAVEAIRPPGATFHHAGEDVLLKELHVLGEQAEQQAVQEMGGPARLHAPLAHPVGQAGETGGGLLSDRLGSPYLA